MGLCSVSAGFSLTQMCVRQQGIGVEGVGSRPEGLSMNVDLHFPPVRVRCNPLTYQFPLWKDGMMPMALLHQAVVKIK